MKKRKDFKEAQDELATSKLVFLDESGFRLGTPPHYGWAPRGESSIGKAVKGHWKTVTMIGAIALDGFRGMMTIDAGTTVDVFRAYIDQVLIPKLNPGDIVVMDNLSTHKNKDIVATIKQAGADVLFTPPYSPEFNPIEKVWSKLKACMHRLDTITRDKFDAAVNTAMDTISLDDIRAWVRGAGYSIT